ncbi:hypothetical protein HN937_05470 [Candidatus Poribacteria bacterium]|jgi:hypothetical protein|nr:hypothetical protein [Candidatus Poribacteria bacterium]
MTYEDWAKHLGFEPPRNHDVRQPGVRFSPWDDADGYSGVDAYTVPWEPYEPGDQHTEPWVLVEDHKVIRRLGIVRVRRWWEIDPAFENLVDDHMWDEWCEKTGVEA